MTEIENEAVKKVTKLETRIQNKLDSLDNWNSSSIELLSGEIALVKTPEESTYGDTDETRSTSTVAMKIGELDEKGKPKPFKDLPWVSDRTAIHQGGSLTKGLRLGNTADGAIKDSTGQNTVLGIDENNNLNFGSTNYSTQIKGKYSRPKYVTSENNEGQDLALFADIPTSTSKLTNDSGYLTNETDPTVPSWAKQTTKPTYTASEVGAEAKGTSETKISAHNTETTAHNDIRLLISNLSTQLNALADSDDTTLDQLSEIVAYIKNNKSLIDNITTSKVNMSDIINDLTTNVGNKPLSAAQGVVLKAMIDAITVPTNLSQLSEDATHRVVTDAEKNTWNNKSNLKQATNGFDGAICAGSDGVAEYGKYCDFHNSKDTTSDYSTRLTCTGDHQNNVNLPSGAGTLVIGDKAYKIVTDTKAPTVDDKSIITIVIQ